MAKGKGRAKGRGGGKSGLPGPVMIAVGLAIGVLIIAIIYTLAPGVGAQVETAVPVSATSNIWNSTCRTTFNLTALPTGSGFFAQNAGLITLIVVVAVISIALAYLIGMAGRR